MNLTTGSLISVADAAREQEDAKASWRDFPGGPLVKTSPPNAGSAGSIPGWGAKIPQALWPKNQNRSNIVTKFNNDFKNGPCQGASLVAQWLGVCLPVQGTRV